MCFAPIENALSPPPSGSLFGSSLSGTGGHQRTMHDLRAEAHHDPPVSQHQLRAENAQRAERIASPENTADAEALEQVAMALVDYLDTLDLDTEFQCDDFHRWADQCRRMPRDFDRRKTAGLFGRARRRGFIAAVDYKLTQGNPERGSNSSPKTVYALRKHPDHHTQILL